MFGREAITLGIGPHSSCCVKCGVLMSIHQYRHRRKCRGYNGAGEAHLCQLFNFFSDNTIKYTKT